MKAPLRLCLLSLIVAPLWAVIPGGVEKIDDLGSKEVLAAARAAVCRLNEMSDSIYETLLVDVTDGTEQVTQQSLRSYNVEVYWSVIFGHIDSRWEEVCADYHRGTVHRLQEEGRDQDHH